ncbi:Large ribosomal subunit protein mL57 [Exophiala dermatitidis]|uniref:RNase III domain-containing protein n=1 Tax=Exophiala dermatitidis (strain ATCC 34100 / CBS 525.76 / NIH/UT8656) TaxID=858893 RepID=H6BWG2_EXODN|nr:uncharacterized protein HMPREF1120_03353 [Exophiala dermatitidis NIH/UT8656]EHY55208.1 hypothetical protein HMPREF1120_03353 [Exophiala dermatitidis NIH/UT8656]
MSSAAITPSRIILDLLRPARRSRCDCANVRPVSRKVLRQCRHVSTATSHFSEMEVDSELPPRWSQTPPAMKAPVRASPPRQGVKTIQINTDQRKLDDVYVKFLGRGGDKLLSEETKWLAVTSKSFDHGRRGFNDRLAFFGKRILELQCSLGLLSVSDAAIFLKDKDKDPHGREPFRHPAIESAECLVGGAHEWFTHHKQLANIATQYGLPEVIRWHPKDPERLQASGADLVYAQAVLAIIGALALEQGGAVANRIAKERVLIPLGLKRDWKPRGEIAEPSQI